MNWHKILAIHRDSLFITNIRHGFKTPSFPSKHSLSTQADSFEKSLSHLKHKLDFSTVDSLLRKSSTGGLLSALRFFIWAGQQPNYRHTTVMYSRACEFLGIHRRPELVNDLLEAYQVERLPVSLKTFKVILNLCREAKLADQALEVLRKIRDFGFRPDTSSYNVVLRLFVEKNQISVAETLLGEMVLVGLYPDMITCVVMVRGLCNAGRLEGARAILQRMRGFGCVPNVVVYSALLDGTCRSGSFGMALELLQEMEGEQESGCEPNVVTYTAVIQGMFEKGRVDEALTVWDRMRVKGCLPNWVTISTVINGLCVAGRVKDAYEVIERMVVEGSATSDQCYSSLVVSLLRIKDLLEAEKLVRKMLESGVRPDGLACESLIKELCLAERVLDGYQWFGKLEAVCGPVLDSDVYSVLVAGLCQQGHLVEAASIVGTMAERGMKARAPFVDGVVQELKAAGENELAFRLMDIGGRNQLRLPLPLRVLKQAATNPSNLTESSCPIKDVNEFASIVDTSKILVACEKVDAVCECCSQICQNAISEAAQKMALKDGGLSGTSDIHILTDQSSTLNDCKSIVLRWLASQLDPGPAQKVLRQISNCNLNKVCPLVFPEMGNVAKYCGNGIDNEAACCNAMDSYISHLQKQSFITNLQALDCAALIELGCLHPRLPSDATLDQYSGISFTCDLNDNIAAPWPSTFQQLHVSSCNKNMVISSFSF
ncbi:hypothetical protein ACLOJK_039457 [Asimina triloba]